MQLETEWIRIGSGPDTLPAYMARPARAQEPLPAIIVIQEIWGVDGHIADLTERFASSGYVAVAPDLYAHGGQRPAALAADRVEAVKRFLDTVPPSAWMNPQERDAAIDRLPEPQRSEIRGTFGTIFSPNRDMTGFSTDLRATAAHLRTHSASRGRPVGSTGYCMGGALSALLACSDPDLAAAVIYYGSAPPDERLDGIRCPVFGFYGGDDPRITGGVPAFAEAMAARGKQFEHRIYPHTPHAFFNDTRTSYRVEAARDAWASTLAFFARHLGGTA
jgi:carboxymethylenebutenolidase